MNEFDLKAPEWDKNQVQLERAEAIAKALKSMIPLNDSMKALEFGAGTGLLSFNLKDNFSGITLIDSSVEMINVIIGKIAAQEVTNMTPVFLDLEVEDYQGEFDIIFSQMTFHHVSNIPLILSKFNSMLKKGGYIAIADLYPEDGTFHGEGFSGHKGFDTAWLAEIVEKSGFTDITHHQCFVNRRITNSGRLREYPIFLMIAKK